MGGKTGLTALSRAWHSQGSTRTRSSHVIEPTPPLARLSPDQLNGRPRPALRILQFGGGNFLRGFMDWKIDLLNQASGSDWGIVALRSIGSAEGSALNAQDGLYTVVSRGLDDEGVTRSEARVVGSVLGEVSCMTQWDQVLAMARDPAVQMVVSNTTEAGIVYAPGMTPRDAPPPSFPAKVTRLLLERWRTLGHLRGTGWQFLPCELTTDSGDLLRSIVLRHATEWEVEAGFVEWIADENVFFNTLVDRIVTGHPGAAAAALEAELGYRDPCLTTAELYHLLVIETPAGRPKPKLRLADFDAGTIEVADAGPYRLRKVALLNGGHTALCPLALICGVETVGEAVRDPDLSAVLRQVLDREIKPFVPLPREELDAFAKDVLRRFANPFLQHRWHDISLNGLVKYQGRLLDRLTAYAAQEGDLPPILTLSLAGWLAFYLGRIPGADRLPPRDAPQVLARMAEIGRDPEGQVAQFLSEPIFWGRSIATPALISAVTRDFARLTGGPVTPQMIANWVRVP